MVPDFAVIAGRRSGVHGYVGFVVVGRRVLDPRLRQRILADPEPDPGRRLADAVAVRPYRRWAPLLHGVAHPAGQYPPHSGPGQEVGHPLLPGRFGPTGLTVGHLVIDPHEGDDTKTVQDVEKEATKEDGAGYQNDTFGPIKKHLEISSEPLPDLKKLNRNE